MINYSNDSLQRVTCGLCGNFDGIDHNDFQLFDGTTTRDLVAFGNSWKVSYSV